MTMTTKISGAVAVALTGALGVADAAGAAPPGDGLGLHPVDGGHWHAGAGLEDARGGARQALVRTVDGDDAHPEVAAVTGLEGQDTSAVRRLGFSVAGDDPGLTPGVRVAFTDALGEQREAMITSRMMRAQPAREAGWTAYTFDAGLPPGGTIQTIELGVHVEQDPVDTRPTVRFDDVVVNDVTFTGPADNGALNPPNI